MKAVSFWHRMEVLPGLDDLADIMPYSHPGEFNHKYE
jgi:hypothetical protein